MRINTDSRVILNYLILILKIEGHKIDIIICRKMITDLTKVITARLLTSIVVESFHYCTEVLIERY